MSKQWKPDTWEDLCKALSIDWEKDVWIWFEGDKGSLEKGMIIDKIKTIGEHQGDMKYSLEDPRTKELIEPLYRCTVCGRVGSVGRCCGDETRIKL